VADAMIKARTSKPFKYIFFIVGDFIISRDEKQDDYVGILGGRVKGIDLGTTRMTFKPAMALVAIQNFLTIYSGIC
jgi:hypothetical protein